MFSFQKRKCTHETFASVITIKKSNHPWFIKVQYTVDRRLYIKSEQLRYQKGEIKKIGCIPVGRKWHCPLGKLQPGDKVVIRYDPRRPKQAYLPDNKGILLL